MLYVKMNFESKRLHASFISDFLVSVTHYPQYRPKNMKNIQARWKSFEMKLILSYQCHDLGDYGCALTLLSFFSWCQKS